MRYTVEDIESSGQELELYQVIQKHIYTVHTNSLIPKGREVTNIHYERGDHDIGAAILTLDNGDEVEVPFDIDMEVEQMDFEPCGYQGLNSKNQLVFSSGVQYKDYDSVRSIYPPLL